MSANLQPFEKCRAAAWWTPKDGALGGLVGGRTNTYGKPRMFSENFSEVYRLHAAVPDTLKVRCGDRVVEEVAIEHAREAGAPKLAERLGLETLAITFGHQHMPALVGNSRRMPKPPTATMHSSEIVADPANDKRQRVRRSTEEKLRILAEADRRTAPLGRSRRQAPGATPGASL